MDNNYRNDIVDVGGNNAGEPIGEPIGLDSTSNVWGMPLVVWIFLGSLFFIGFALKGKKKKA